VRSILTHLFVTLFLINSGSADGALIHPARRCSGATIRDTHTSVAMQDDGRNPDRRRGDGDSVKSGGGLDDMGHGGPAPATEGGGSSVSSGRPVNEVPAGSIIVIPMSGAFGKSAAKSGKGFGAEGLEHSIQIAVNTKPSAIVLDVGMLSGGTDEDLADILRSLVRLQKSGVRIVAWPGPTSAPGVEVTLACKEVIARPTSVLSFDAGSEMKAPPAKLRSEIEELTGRSYCLETALREPSAELWWSPSTHAFRNTGGGGDWKRLDGPNSRMSLNADSLIELNISRASADNTAALVQALSKTNGKPVPPASQIFTLEPNRTAPNNSTAADTDPQTPGNDASRVKQAQAFREKCKVFRKLLETEMTSLRSIQAQFPGPMPEGDQRDETWRIWATRYEFQFKGLRSKAVQSLSKCARQMPTNPGSRPAEVRASDWSEFLNALKSIKWALEDAKRDISEEVFWMTHGAGPALKLLEACHEQLKPLADDN